MAALYWRIVGQGELAVKCLRHSLYYSDNANKVLYCLRLHTHLYEVWAMCYHIFRTWLLWVWQTFFIGWATKGTPQQLCIFHWRYVYSIHVWGNGDCVAQCFAAWNVSWSWPLQAAPTLVVNHFTLANVYAAQVCGSSAHRIVKYS